MTVSTTASATATATASATAQRLLDAARQLAVVLADENAALTQRTAGALKPLLARKAAAVRAYEDALTAFTAQPAAALDPALAAALRAAAQSLAAATRENTLRLDVARAAQRLVIEHIVDAAKQVAPGPGTYARNGTIGASSRARPPQAASLSFNRAL